MKRIRITGANGYIGTALKERLQGLPDRYETETRSVRDFAADSTDFHGVDAVVHAAAVVHRKETAKTAPLYDAVNRDLTFAIAKEAKRQGVRQFVFLSSLSVYGMETGVITGETVPDPKTRYGRSKLEAERLIAPLADESFTVTVVRAPTVFGTGAKGNYRRLERLTKRLPFVPAFENRRSMASIDTLCEALQSYLDDPKSGVFFPQEPQPVRTADLIARIAAEQGRTLKPTRLLNPAIRVFRFFTHGGKKAFGDLLYRGPDMLPLSEVFLEEESS